MVCFHLVEHLTSADFIRLFREIVRVPRPGEHVFLKTPTVRNVWNTPTHVRPYPESAFRKLTGLDGEANTAPPFRSFPWRSSSGERRYRGPSTASFGS